jgi:imidazolonepropionase-like amidohydrolase
MDPLFVTLLATVEDSRDERKKKDMKERILLKNINLFDVENATLRNNVDILIEGDIIKDVGEVNYTEEENLTHLDCSGKFAIPGLFECHAHLALLTSPDEETKKQIMEDFGTTKENELEKQVLKEFVVRGITQARDVGGPVKVLKELKDSISNGKFPGPDIFYAGPMLEKSPLLWEEQNKALPGFTVAVNSKQDAKNIIREIAHEGASLVKTFNKFDFDVFRYLLEQAKEYNLPVVHDPGTTLFQSIPMDLGIDLGIRCFEHGKAPWPIVLKDDLKLEHDSLIEADSKDKEAFRKKNFSLGIQSVSLTKLQQLIDKMLQNDVYFCPTLHAFKYMQAQQSKEPNKDMLDRLEVLVKISLFFTQEMIKQNVKILVGQDGLIPRFTFDEMRYLKELGLSEPEIIKGATICPAEWLGIVDQFGSISPNKKASIVILNKNPLEDIQNIKTTYAVLQKGKIVFRE